MKQFRSLWGKEHPQAIIAGMIPSRFRLLLLGPHPDDFDSIGATLRFLYESGNHLQVVVVQTSSGVLDDYVAGITKEEKARIREKEQRASVRFFGLPETALTFISLSQDRDGVLLDNAENFHILEGIVLDKSPDIIFLPHGNDTNNSHRVMCSLTRQIAARSTRPMALFLNRDAKTLGMRTDFYFPFGEELMRWKGELLRFHDTQQKRNLIQRGHGFDDRVLNLNAKTARELKIDAPYAEAFEAEFYNIATK